MLSHTKNSSYKITLLAIFLSVSIGSIQLVLASVAPAPDVPVSYSFVPLNTNSPASAVQPQSTLAGSSPLSSVTLESGAGITVNLPELNSIGNWEMANEATLSVAFNLSELTMVQLAFSVYTNDTACTLSALINADITPVTVKCFDTTASQSPLYVYRLPLDSLQVGANTVTLMLNSKTVGDNFKVKAAILAPQKIYANSGVLDTSIYAQFGQTNIPGNANPIWTRSYGLLQNLAMLPAPTFYYKPGDLLSVNLENYLDLKGNLKTFEEQAASHLGLNPDEALDNVADAIRQEVNIPHNLNNTNLHVHGLHVDPSKDDVTIVIVPQDESGTVNDYDAPAHGHAFELDQINEGSVADQAVKGGNWEYDYRIPSNHLPGTHWYHPHKHGSTAAQLENGMAGSQVIQEPVGLEIFPNAAAGWEGKYDRVMMIQEINNYGTGAGTGPVANGPNANSNKSIVTINGEHIPQFTLPAGQVARWRFVNAGANHRSFNHMWLGKNTGKTDAGGNPIYVSQPMWSVAFDGITLSSLVEITAEKPQLMAPGNRADVLVQIPTTASTLDSFTLFKYYPNNISIVDASYYASKSNPTAAELQNHLRWDCSAFTANSACTYSTATVKPLVSAFSPSSNPYLFTPTGTGAFTPLSGGFGENFQGFTQQWQANKSGGSNTTPPANAPTGVVPLIKVAENSQQMLDVSFAAKSDFPTPAELTATPSKGAGLWQPQYDGFGGGAIPAQQLLTLKITDKSNAINPKKLPKDSYLSKISPTGSFKNGKKVPGFLNAIPPYVHPFTDEDILQSRPVAFDKSGASVKVIGSGGSSGSSGVLKVNQFTLNGRPFALNDMIGNSTKVVNERLQETVSYSSLKSVDVGTKDAGDNNGGVSNPNPTQCTEGATNACLNIEETLEFMDGAAPNYIAKKNSKPNFGHSSWTNDTCSSEPCSPTGLNGEAEPAYHWANPSYFQNLSYSSQYVKWLTGSTGDTSAFYSDKATCTAGDSGAAGLCNQVGYGFSSDASANPSWEDITGLSGPAVVNTNSKYQSGLTHITGKGNGLPGRPIATTAEEWVLVNNSDIGHPFHIHINPFFVVEVGQLSYETFASKGVPSTDTSPQWIMRAVSVNDLPEITSVESKAYSGTSASVSTVPEASASRVYKGTNDISDFVGNWWDTVIIPPHGYIKVRYWINVPDQISKAVVKDNQNKVGIWVYHCHILRHEDRGMMMPVITQKLQVKTPPE